MKIQVPADFNGTIIDADGTNHIPDDHHQIDVPDGKLPLNLWGMGFFAAAEVQPEAAEVQQIND